jgi:hypothetical protein
MATNSNEKDLTLTIIFGCLATVLALAGIAVGYVQYRSYNRTSTTASSPSSLEAGLTLSPITPGNQPQEQDEADVPPSPIVPGGRTPEQPESDLAPKSDDVEVSSTPSSSDSMRKQDGHSSFEIARASA